MDSITQNFEFVNEKFQKWTEKKRKNMKISDKMVDAGFRKRGILMRECGTFIHYKTCPDCGKSYISSSNLCRDRLCPTCAWRLSLKRFAEMCQIISKVSEFDMECAGFLTLTVRNCKPENLRYTIKKMNEDWNRMLASRKIKGILLGWAKSLEITYNPENNTFHPHFHVILLFDNFLGEGETQKFFRKAWDKACRLPYEPITDFRLIEEEENISVDNDKVFGAILETFKYSVKDSEIEDMPLGTFRQFVQAISGMRFVSYGGIIKTARRELGMEDNEEDIENNIELSRDLCTCGAELIKVVCQWSFTEKQYKRLEL